MLASGALLGQVRPADTNNATLFAADQVGVEVTRIVVCNVSGGAATCRVFHDVGGAAFDQSNALRYDVNVPGGSFIEIIGESMGAGLQLEAGDAIGVRSSVADALTFTAYGVTEKLADRQTIRGNNP